MKDRESIEDAPAWARWVVGLDKYINNNQHKKLTRPAFWGGVFFVGGAFALAMTGITGMWPVKAVIGLLGTLFMYWYVEAHVRDKVKADELRRKYPDCCFGCYPDELPNYGDEGWIRKRFFMHYNCTVLRMLFSFFNGGLLMAIIGFFIDYLIVNKF